jgi:AraC-like DNA-binding protein
MAYREHPPGSALAAWVAAYWQFSVEPGAGAIAHTVPPTGGVILSIPVGAGRVRLIGPRLTPLRPTVHGGDRFWGVHFWPGAASAILPPGLGTLRERVVPAEVAFGRAATDGLKRRLRRLSSAAEAIAAIEGLLVTRLPEARPLDDAVMAGVLRLIGSAGRDSIDRVAAGVGLSGRHFRRRFARAVGLTPKELARLRRLRASAVDAVDGSAGWSAIAADRGFSDQPHLAAEFRRLVGLSPAAFLDHARRIVHGQLVAGLPRD